MYPLYWITSKEGILDLQIIFLAFKKFQEKLFLMRIDRNFSMKKRNIIFGSQFLNDSVTTAKRTAKFSS